MYYINLLRFEIFSTNYNIILSGLFKNIRNEKFIAYRLKEGLDYKTLKIKQYRYLLRLCIYVHFYKQIHKLYSHKELWRHFTRQKSKYTWDGVVFHLIGIYVQNTGFHFQTQRYSRSLTEGKDLNCVDNLASAAILRLI